MKPYENVLNVVNEITRISKLPVNTEEFREEAENVAKLYNDLDPLDIRLVVNYDKLLVMQEAIEKAQKVEIEIVKIDSGNFEGKNAIVADARAAYNTLSATERKYVLKELLDLLTSWEKSTATATTINKQIDAIKTDVFTNLGDDKLTDTKKRSTVTSFITKVRTAESSFTKIEDNQQGLVTNRARLEALIPLTKIADQVVNLNFTSTTYTEDLILAENKLNEWDSFNEAIPLDEAANVEKLHQFLISYLRLQKEEQSIAAKLDADILLFQKADVVDLQQIDAAREKYNSLSANGKRLVKNIKVLTELEKENKAVLNTIQAISKIDVMAKDFTRKTTAAETTFNKLAEPMQGLVYNREKLVELLPFAKLMLKIDALRPTAAEFKVSLSTLQTDFENILKNYTAPAEPITDIENIQLRLFTEYGKKLTDFEMIVSESFSMESRIDALQTKSGEAFITDLAEVSAAYKSWILPQNAMSGTRKF